MIWWLKKQVDLKKIYILKGDWDVGPEDFFVEGARIEAAFRKYFHRADPKQVGIFNIYSPNKIFPSQKV